MSEETLEQMKADFVADSSEMLDRLAQRLSELDRQVPLPRDLVDELLRRAHSLRGTAGMFGLDDSSALAKSFESLLEAVRSGSVAPTPDLVDLSIEVLDALGVLLRERPGSQSGAEAAISRIELLLRTAKGEACETPETARGARTQVAESALVPLSVKVDIALLDSIMNTVSELFSVKVALAATTRRLPRESATRRLADELLKVSLMLDKRLLELQSSVIDARLVPVSILFHRYRAEVRRLARLAGKDVELSFEGESTRIDRAVLDRLYDPLLHIIRNAVGHGIETRKERGQCGKSLQGRITLRASQEASHVRIEVEDDGRGIDLDRVMAVAVAKGHGAVDADCALELLFRPGFTTKGEQDEISGRGVGLDAVRIQVEALRGMVSVSTRAGEGTRFSLWVPLTLAMSRGMLIEEGSVPVAVPMGCVVEVVHLTAGTADQAGRTGRIDYGGGKVIALGLAEILKSPRVSIPRSVVIVGIGDRRRAVFVEKVCGEVEIVARPLPETMAVPGLITGATELHDGRPAVVVQPEEILRIDRVTDLGHDRICGSGAARATDVTVAPAIGGPVRVVVFRRGAGLYAVPIAVIEEILPASCVTELAAAGDWWEGIFFVKGLCYGLLSIPGGERRAERAGSKIITLRNPKQCGIWADEAIADREVGPSDISAAPESDGALLTLLGCFAWQGNTVRLLGTSELNRRLLGDGSAGVATMSCGGPKNLMRLGLPDDNHRG